MRQGYSAEQWSVWIGEQSESDLTIADFCDSIGVSENSFYAWRRKLRANPAVAASRTSVARSDFVELAVSEARLPGVLEIAFPCGAVVRLPGEESLIGHVLGVLLEAGACDSGGSSC